MLVIQAKLNPGLTWQKQHLTRRAFHQQKQVEVKFKEKKELVQGYIWSTALCTAEPLHFGKETRNICEFGNVVLEKEDQPGRWCE